MKKIKYIFLTLTLLLTFAACTDDDKLIYNPDNAKPGELAPINPTYVLEPTKTKEIFATFKWEATDFGYQASVKYTLQADIAGNNFANAQEVTATSKLSADVNTATMNKTILKLLSIYQLPDASQQTIELRIAGSISAAAAPVYSNVITSVITPYSDDVEYPKVSVIGDYSGWNFKTSQGLFDFEGNSVNYQGWVYFGGKAANGFKIAIPDADGKWVDTTNWGTASGQTVEPEATSVILLSDAESGNIKAYSKDYYFFKFDRKTNTLTKVYGIGQMGIVGDAAANGWNGPDVPFEFDNTKQLFVATVTLGDGEIKFRADNTWGAPELGGADGKLTQGGANIKVTSGTYKITLNLNNPDNMTYKIEDATSTK